MTDYEYIQQKIHDGMFQSHMHECLRDIGSLAGGFLAAGRLTAAECDSLCEFAKSMAINSAEAERKWKSAVVYGTAKPVATGRPSFRHEEKPQLDWSTPVNEADYRMVDENWLEVENLEQPDDSWNPCAQLGEYLSLLFQPDEFVGYCIQPFERDGKWLPDKGIYTNKAGDISKGLAKKSTSAFERAVGTINNDKSGAWIRINPLDGNGVSDANITEFRHALVESDGMDVEKQVAIYRKLELPCACIVHSGGKSAHAIVKVYANSLDEYRKRVDFLYEVCANNGLPVDKQNRNPSRYSRMPGVLRNGRKQYIIERNCGKASWDEWENWVKDLNDKLPDFESLESLDIYNPPPLKPVVIDGILREGAKLRLQGPSKAGKSFALIELAIAMSEGLEWLGHKCRQGRVLYINLELDKASARNRFAAIYKALKINPSHMDMIDTWDLRGKTLSLDKLTPKLIRRAKDRGYSLIILDPIYKVLTGDENSASEMAAFCNYFDQIVSECGCSFVDCHHHSKGAQAGKRAMDRSSGSGVFARDPDAIIDFLPLNSDAAERVLKDDILTSLIENEADKVFYDGDWRSRVGLDQRAIPKKFLEGLRDIFPSDDVEVICNKVRSFLGEFSASGWEVSYTVRDFRTPKNRRLWFTYPIHTSEKDYLLADCKPEGEDEYKGSRKAIESTKLKPVDRLAQEFKLDPHAYETVDEIRKRFKVSDDTVRRWAKIVGFKVANNEVCYLGEKPHEA